MTLTEDQIAAEEAKHASIERAMEAEGQSSSARVPVDYFGFDETFKVYLDDEQYIVHRALNEGARRKYLDAVNREVRLQKSSGDAVLKMQTGSERHALLEQAIVDWNLMRDGRPEPFTKGSPGSSLSQFLQMANPKIIDRIYKDIAKHNPWLLAEVTVEEIDKQIEELNEMREQLVREEEGKVS